MSPVVICNMALNEVGAGPITSLDDDTKEAQICRLWYTPLRDAVLQEGAWTFATARAALVPDATPPDWGYSARFLLPNNTLLVREVYDDPENYQPTIHPWEIEGQYLLIDQESVWVRYMMRIEDTSQFSPMFIQALVFRMASEIAIPLVQSRQLHAEMEGKYQERMQNALNSDGTQGQNRKVKSKGRLTNIRGAYYGRGIRQ